MGRSYLGEDLFYRNWRQSNEPSDENTEGGVGILELRHRIQELGGHVQIEPCLDQQKEGLGFIQTTIYIPHLEEYVEVQE